MYVIADHSNQQDTKLLIQNITKNKTYYLYLNEDEFNIFKKQVDNPKTVKLVAFHTKFATEHFIKNHELLNPEIIKI